MRRGFALLAALLGLSLVIAPAAADAAEATPVTATSKRTFSVAPADLGEAFSHLPLLPEGERNISVNAYLSAPATVAAGMSWRVVTPAEIGLSNEDAARLRRFVGRSRELSTPLGSLGTSSARLEAAAVQAAVWAVLRTARLDELPPGEVRERAAELLELSAQPTAGGAQQRPDAGAFGLVARQEPLGADVQLTVQLLDDQGRALEDELVTVAALDEPTVARLTKGGAARVVVNLPSTPLDYTARWSTRLPAGTFLSTGDGPGRLVAITADGPPVTRASGALTVQPFSEQPMQVAKSAVNLAIGRDKHSSMSDLFVLAAAVIVVVVTLVGVTALISLLRGDPTVLRVSGVLLLLGVAWLGYSYHEARADSPAVRAPEPGQAFPAESDPPLPLLGIRSSTEREPRGDRCYAASSAVDGRLDTAWVSSAGQGTQQALALQLDGTHWVTSLQIAIGVQRSPTSFTANGRPVRLEVLGDAGWHVAVDDLPQVEGLQTIELDRALLTNRLVVRIVEVTEGWNSSGISELALHGAGIGPDDLEQLTRYTSGEVIAPPFFTALSEQEPRCAGPAAPANPAAPAATAAPTPAAVATVLDDPSCDEDEAKVGLCRLLAAAQSLEVSPLSQDERTMLAADPLPPGRWSLGECELVGDVTVSCVAVAADASWLFTLVPVNASYDDGELTVEPGQDLRYEVQGYERVS